MKQNLEDVLGLGTWLGRKQAFGLLAGKCSAADAECLKKIRDEKKYKALGLTWEQFCRTRLGISRGVAEKIIRLVEEFGKQFFELSAVVRITAEEYRLIAPSVTAEGVRHGDRLIEISMQNAPALSQAVEELRQQATPPEPAPTGDDFDRTLARARRSMRAGMDAFRMAGRMGLTEPGKLLLLQQVREASAEISRFGLEEVASGRIFLTE